ncbi:MAG: hypothetical protein HRT94_06115 [Alphaproteobacteria bacterium]|nr:hypothetical protein [Alphaproteobacteria bacterium]
MHIAYGFSHSADAAANLARARAAGIGGKGSQATVGSWELPDGMFQAFCQVNGSPEDDISEARLIELSPNHLLRMLERSPWLLQKYPWVLDQYLQMFNGARSDGYNRTLN